jgi:dihydropteroate synthase
VMSEPGEVAAGTLDDSVSYRTASSWQVRGRSIELDRPRILGVINVTPDSFSDGGNFFSVSAAVEHAARLLEEGADILDIGGESTRPQGATPVSVQEEIDRVVPVISEVSSMFPSCVISVDTVKAKVAAVALEAGAHIVNDVSAFRLDSGMAHVCSTHDAGVVLMHSRGTVEDMATYVHASYNIDAVGEIFDELLQTVNTVIRRGIRTSAIAIDPGIGFSKLSVHSIAILRRLEKFTEPGFPLMVGVSRKRFIGELSGIREPAARVYGSVAANVLALTKGARLFRVHDVLATRQALDVAWGIISREED